MRLNKFIAQAGAASRRKADELIKSGQVKVNGKVVDTLGVEIDENKDKVVLGQRHLTLTEDKVYIAMNKPVGYITSSSSAQGKTVLDLIRFSAPDKIKLIKNHRLYPVGRLDRESRGLIFLTDDGDFAYKLTHAKFGTEKEYTVELDRPLIAPHIKMIEKGMTLDEEQLQPVRTLKQEGNKINLILTEGVNRQIRRMMDALGYKVRDLKRVRIAQYELTKIKEGEWIQVYPQEVFGRDD